MERTLRSDMVAVGLVYPRVEVVQRLLRWFDVCFGFKVEVKDGVMDMTRCGA